MKVRLFLIAIFSTLYFFSSFAQDDAETVLKNIQNKFNTIDDLSAELLQLVNGEVNLKGKVYYKKENHLRFEFKNILLISDGETSWSYNQKDNKVVVSDYENEGNKILSIRQIIYEYPDDCEMSTFESEGMTVLQLIPNEDTFHFNSIELFINEDYLINKAVIDDPAAGSIGVHLSNYQLNKNLSDSLFEFSPPEGSEIIDLR
jgi:outer membrane lipoprotein carrier protein